jgi:hypothetical protein
MSGVPSGGPGISNCSNNFVGGAMTLVTSGRWTLTATSTTKATLAADTTPTSGGVVLSTSFGFLPSCSPITVNGPISIANQAWSNTTHQLTISPVTPLTLHTPSGPCSELFGSTINVSGTFTFPNSVTITP